jgi:dCTP deaminase
MILTSKKIQEELQNGKITIEPFKYENLNPNSYNLCLSNSIAVYENDVLDVKKDEPIIEKIIPPEGLLLQPNQLYLGNSIEIVGSNYYVPFLFGRSSTGRLGLFVQITAPLGDIGFLGKWTFMLKATVPLIVYPEMKIAQILFIAPVGDIELYNGKYQNSNKLAKSSIFNDFI